MLQKLYRKPILSLVIFVLILFGFHLDVLQVSIMEARNFITAREMVVDGNWLLTTMNGEARYQKPPLPTWICAIFALIFGIKNVIALRLPAILFIAITGVYTFLLSEKLTKKRSHSFNNALIAITSFYVIGIAFEAPSDIFTHSFMLIGIYQLFQLFQKKTSLLKHSLIAGFFIGCSILSKGPVSFYVLLLPFLLAYGFSFKYKFSKRLLFSFLLCLLVALLVGGWWYGYVRIYDTETFTTIAEKETGNWTSYNVRPFYYYWSFFIQSGIWTIPAFAGLLFPYIKSRVSNLKAYKFSFYWTIFAVILLSIIPEKKSRYLMPVLIPLAINTGFYIEYLIRNFRTLKDKREALPVYFNFGLIAGIALAVPLIAYFFLGEALDGFWIWFILLSIATFTIGVLLIIQLKKKQMKNVFGLTIVFLASLLILGLPLSEAMKSDYYHPISNLKAEMEAENIKVYGFNYVAPEMIWQFGDTIPPIKTEDGQIHLPTETTFGMLANGISPEDQAVLKSNYSIEKISTYDLNWTAPENRGYYGRLHNDFYILTKLPN